MFYQKGMMDASYLTHLLTDMMTTRRRMDPLFKTTMCQFIPNCRNGMNCKYAHAEDELQKVMSGNDLSPDDFVYRTKMCDYGDMCINEGCGFAHSEGELRRIPCKFQSFCKHWDTTCNRAHFFVEGYDAVICPAKKNTSLSMQKVRLFQVMEKNLIALDTKICALEHKMDEVMSESLGVVEEKHALLQELDAFRSEIQEEIDDLDWMTTPIQRSRMTDWAASDSEDDEPAPALTTTPPVATPPTPATRTWAGLLHGMQDKQPVIFPKPAHSVSHPAGKKYRTKMCKYGKACNRKKLCGFAHYESQLRDLA